jgi:hypothetical protein
MSSRDAELIAACAAFDALEMRVRRLFCGPGDTAGEDARDAAMAVIAAEQEPFLAQICALSATMLDGHRARVRSLALWAPDLGDGGRHRDRSPAGGNRPGQRREDAASRASTRRRDAVASSPITGFPIIYPRRPGSLGRLLCTEIPTGLHSERCINTFSAHMGRSSPRQHPDHS